MNTNATCCFSAQARITLCLLCALLIGFVPVALPQPSVSAQQTLTITTTPAPTPYDGGSSSSRRLEVIEDLSESLANQLLELSTATRDRNWQLTAEFFPDQFAATRFPAQPQAATKSVKWISTRNWKTATLRAPKRTIKTGVTSGLAANASVNVKSASTTTASVAAADSRRRTTRAEFMRDWKRFLNHFSEIEDVRFKVKEAHFEDSAQSVPNAKVPLAASGAGGRARIAFYVIGRNRVGEREWARGTTNVTVRYVSKANIIGKAGLTKSADAKTDQASQGRWQFESWNLASFDSLVASKDIFSEVAVPAGVAVQRPAYGQPGNGGFVWHGAAAADFDRDGWIDLFVTAPARNYVYLNDRAGKFRDGSKETGADLLASGAGPLALDYDNDGDSDVFIAAVGQQVMMENRFIPDGKLEFRDVSLEVGVAKDAIGFSAVAGDVNADGRLDIFVASYNRYGQVTPDSWFRATNGTPDLLFISQPDGTYREEAEKWGVADRRWGYAAAFADVNEDGRLDLYLANDFGEKAMYINKGNRFVDEARERGVLDPGNGMGVSFGDYNNDGLLDLHASNMSSTAGNRILSRLFPNASAQDNVLKKLAAGNNLFENLGAGKYKDVTTEVGGFSGGWAWGGGFIDFDNDGWEDIFTPNGFISGKSMKDT